MPKVDNIVLADRALHSSIVSDSCMDSWGPIPFRFELEWKLEEGFSEEMER